MRNFIRIAGILAIVALSGCATMPGGPKGGTLKVVVDMPHFSGLNAGSNAVDGNNVNRAVSDLLVLDNAGKKSIILHMNGKDTFFETGTVLTVYFNVWKGDQSNNDYKYNGRKTVTIDGNTTITFNEVSIPENYGLSEQTAIKTGDGPRGERAYLDMLSGPNGEKIKYKRLGSCCQFKTPNSPFETGLLDRYEVSYEGLDKPVIVYLNMYDPPTGLFFPPPGFKLKDKTDARTISSEIINKYEENDNKTVWMTENDIIHKIKAGDFKDIERHIDKLVTQKPYTASGTRVLERLYSFIGNRLQTLDMLDKWCAKEPSHHSAFIFRGNYYIEQAWKHRGHGFAGTVTQDGWVNFRKNLELAQKDLEKAYEMNPNDPNSAASMITVSLGLSRSEEEKETWFIRAISADPGAYSAYALKQNYLRPKWGGTKEKDRAFAEHCFENAPAKSIIHEIMLDYIIENYQQSENKAYYYSDPLIKKTIDDVAQKTLTIFPNSISIRSKLALIENNKGNHEEAIELYNEILSINPINRDALYERGNLYRRLGKMDLAEADFKMIMELDPASIRRNPNLVKDKQIVLDSDRSFYFNRELKYTAKKGDKLTILVSQPCLGNSNSECWCVRHELYGVGCAAAIPHLLESNAE